MEQYTTRKTGTVPPRWDMVPPKTPIHEQEGERSGSTMRTNSTSFARHRMLMLLRVQEQCRQLAFSTFFRQGGAVSSLGFTSAIAGEGKSFLALLTAQVFSEESHKPVLLVDANWKHPSLHEALHCPAEPGLAEWLRGECHESAILHHVSRNLTFIPAGNGAQDATKLLQQVGQRKLLDRMGHPDCFLIIDLPAILSCAYATLAASMADSLVFVVCAAVTPKDLVKEAYAHIADLPIQGAVLNQVKRHIPGWLQQML
jgi:Mrp family chromosome partitioning ATPase